MFPFPLVPKQGSEFAPRFDALFAAITALTVFFTVVVLAVVVFFAIRYRVGSKADRSNPQNENLRIEIAWSLPPLFLGLLIFAWGAAEFLPLRRPPKNAIDIFVMGKQWMWHIQHPNGVREMNTLHVPSGVPVKLTMISQDVIHAFYVPQFRIQYMVVPGRYTYEWFTPTNPGRYYLFCAQHCGTQHSEMGGYVYVMSQADYAAWLARGGQDAKAPTMTMRDKGEELYTQLNCVNCHGSADTERGPSLYGLFGKQVQLEGGGSQQADDDFVRESIVDPYRHLVKGYTETMPSDYKKQMTEEDIRNLLEYIKSLGAPPAKPPAVQLSTATKLPQASPPATPPQPEAGTPSKAPRATGATL